MSDDYLRHMTEADDSVLEHLAVTYWQDIWHYAFLITRDAERSNDIAQDVFVKACQSLSSFRGEASVKTWLLRIARNTAYTYQRSAFLRKVILLDIVAPKGAGLSAEQQYFDAQAANGAWACVMKLPRHYREAILLDAHYELPMEQIAQVLGISIGTVKSRLHRARKHAAALMKEEDL